MNLTERAEIRKETFYKLTNSRDVPKAPSGTRNYITNYATSSTDWYSNVSGWKIETVEDSTARFGRYIKATCTKPGDSDSNSSGFYKRFIDIAKHSEFFNQTMTWSMDIKTSKNTKLKIGCEWGNAVSNINATGNWQRFSKTFEVATSSSQKAWIFYGSNWGVGDIVYIRDVQFEHGPNATTPSQAPEDFGWSKDPLVPTQSNRYLWKFEYIYYSDGSVEIAGPVNLSISGQDGIAGKDGVGLKTTVITYGLSTSETTPPTSWYAQVPTLTKGKYLWTKTVWTYTDNTTETGYQKTYIARDGNDGNDGIPGKDGVGIKSTTITYAGSTSGATPPKSGWTSSIPSVPAGQYLWTKTVWTYTDNTSETGYSVAKMGEDGVIESNGENRIFYGRGDTKKGFFKNATIGTDWNGVPYGEFDDPRLHTTSASNIWVGMTTTEGLKLLGNSGNIPTGKWTLSHDIYITDSMADTTYLQNIIRMHRTDGTFTDLVTIDMSARDVGKKPVSIPTNYGRRAIWNPEPDRESYGGRPLINPLEVSIHNNSPVKITTKCVPDEIGNGVAQYTIEPTSSNPTCSFYIWSVANAIPKDTNKTWTATLKIRANRNCTFSDLGFERFSVMRNVTIKPEWQTLYFNGKASGDYGAFILYGLGPQALTSKLVIEIAEVKICDENVPKEIMKDVLLTRYWYRMSSTKTFTDAQRIGLNGSMTGGISVEIPAGKKTDAKVRLRNVSLRRGDVEIPFAPAPEDIYDQNDSKVDQDQLDQIANELRDRQDRLAQELAAKALASEVSELTTQLKNLKESDLAGKADITNAVASLEKRLANVIPLGNMAQKLEFIDSYILQGEEGMEIGNKNSGSKVMITPDRIGFFSGGTEVASFSSGQLRINNGFFADTITVGHFMTRRHPNNQYVNGTYFVK